MHSKWGAIATVLWLSGCVLLGPGADPDSDDSSEEGGSYVHGGVSGNGGVGGVGGTNVPRPTAYSCFEQTTTCRCDRLAYATASRCKYDWTCCIESEDADSCECFDSDACAAEVASRPGARQVETCPGGAEQQPIACADVDENCTRAFLDENELEGCCDGLVCAPNASGVRTCRFGTADEVAFARQCADDRTDGLVASSTLATSEGEVAIAAAEATIVNLGADGCFSDFSLTLSPMTGSTSTFACALRAQVGPGRDAEGRLLVGGLQLFAMQQFGCTGFPPGVDGLYTGGTASGSLTFEGLSCESALTSELCAAGRFTLVLDGELAGMRLSSDPTMTSVSLAFDSATLTLDGRLCDYATQGTACPAQQ
jgi:hypothetical protein